MTNIISVSNDSIFNFNGFPVRIEIMNEEPWFCLADCSTALSIRQVRTDRLPERGVTICHLPTKSGNQDLVFINEPNLYRLIFRSNKPQAQAFADWVYSEVLPAIRRTGCYSTAPGVDMKALGGLVKRCCRASIKEYWIDFISGKPETVNAVRQTLEWLIKSCFNSLLAEVLNNPGVDKFKTYQPLSDEDMLRCLQMWYAGRNKQTVGELQQLFEENGLLRSKLAKIRKTAAE
jgi:hypothetical protein